MTSNLTEEQIETFLQQHDRWTRDGVSISRTYVFSDFNESLGFVVRIGAASEVADHHPDIDVRWNKVTCVLTTHSEGALTSRDIALATAFDAMANQR